MLSTPCCDAIIMPCHYESRTLTRHALNDIIVIYAVSDSDYAGARDTETRPLFELTPARAPGGVPTNYVPLPGRAGASLETGQDRACWRLALIGGGQRKPNKHCRRTRVFERRPLDLLASPTANLR